MLMVPMLHQGGFERVCVATARLMQEFYNVYILIFSSKDINYDVTGLEVIDIDVPAQKGIVNKVFNVFKRVNKVKKIKKDLGIDIAYSFGGSANYVNVLSKGKEKVLTGLRCQTDMENAKQVRLFCSRSDQVLSCSKEIMRQLHTDFSYDKSSYIYNPLDEDDVTTYCGALSASVKLIQERYPYIRIVVISPPACGKTIDDYYVDATQIDLANGTLNDYIGNEVAVCATRGISFIDIYFGVINVDTRDKYLNDDYHINEEGAKAVAARFVKLIPLN